MIYVHYDRLTGEVLGAYHSSNDVIPTPNIQVADDVWAQRSGFYKVDLATLSLVEVKEELTEEQIDELRRNAYIKESDPLFFKWQRKECTKTDWTNKIKEIKQRYPKSTD